MPIKIPNNLPALPELISEQVDIITNSKALRQDIRPLRILLLNLMPKKQETEIQFVRLLGNSPLQVELTLMTTCSYEPTNTESGYLNQFYKCINDIKDEYFDALIITGAPVEKLEFQDVKYWEELTDIMEWSKTHCFRRVGICWGAQALLSYFHNVPKHGNENVSKHFGVFQHKLNNVSSRLMHGFTSYFPMPVSRYTETRVEDLEKIGFDVLAHHDKHGVGIAINPDNNDLFILNHLEYDTDSLEREYTRDAILRQGPGIPKNYFPNNDPRETPVNCWRPYAFLLFGNWLNDLYQSTPFNLSDIQNKS